MSKGLKLFGEQGKEAANSEIRHLHNRQCFEPLSVNELSYVKRQRAQQATMLLTEKRDCTKKCRSVFDLRATREGISKEDLVSLTATLECIMLTVTIHTNEGREVLTDYVPD